MGRGRESEDLEKPSWVPDNSELLDDSALAPGADADTARKSSHFISRVLTPAVRLWLKSQLDQVEDLVLTIDAGDRQLLSGAIHQVTAAATKAVYQGIHLSQVHVTSQNIQTNLRQMLRGKPFRLLAAFPVAGTVTLSAADLNASLQSPLLADAVTDFLLSLIQPDAPATERSASLQDIYVELGEGSLSLKALLVQDRDRQPLSIRTALQVERGNLLKLSDFELRMESTEPARSAPKLPSRFTFPLGSDVQIERLTIHDGKLICQGEIRVMP